MQSMLTLVLTGQYSRKIFQGLSVGHVFMIMLMYITMWLLNFMGCSWIWLAGIEGKENSWMQSIGTPPPSCALPFPHLLHGMLTTGLFGHRWPIKNKSQMANKK